MKGEIISSDLLKEAQIEIRPMSSYIDRKKLDEKPHRHPFQEIIYIISGEGKHTIDGQVFDLSEHTLYVIGEGQVHEFLEGQNLKGYLLRYKDSFLPSELSHFSARYAVFQIITDSNALKLNSEEAQIFTQNFIDLLREKQREESLEGNQVFHFLLLTLLSRINRVIKKSSFSSLNTLNDREALLHRRFVILLEDSYRNNHEVGYYSDQLNSSQRQLTSVLLTKTGMTTKQHINRRLIIEGKRLLQFTNLSFKEISYKLGYKEPAYFSRLFKIKTGKNPKEFRQAQL